MLTKQGFTVWSTQPGVTPFRFEDVSEQVAAALETVEVDETLEGPATVRAYTVLYEANEPAAAVVWCDSPDGRRTVARSSDPELMRTATESELCGRAVTLSGDEFSLA